MSEKLIPLSATPYRQTRTEHEANFREFIDWAQKDESVSSVGSSKYLIQYVRHPNFQQNNTDVKWFKKAGSTFVEVDDSSGYKRANAYKNFRTAPQVGNPNGMFYELNLYTSDAQMTSQHHTSTISGSSYVRDGSHDKESIPTKGPHW